MPTPSCPTPRHAAGAAHAAAVARSRRARADARRHGRRPGSFKSQFKKADASGATYALIFGADELARGEVTLKALRDGSGAQTARPLAEVATWAATLQSPAPNT
jgi:histidyl-tRNA synthetase